MNKFRTVMARNEPEQQEPCEHVLINQGWPEIMNKCHTNYLRWLVILEYLSYHHGIQWAFSQLIHPCFMLIFLFQPLEYFNSTLYLLYYLSIISLNTISAVYIMYGVSLYWWDIPFSPSNCALNESEPQIRQGLII